MGELAELDAEEWFEYWHAHPDLWGKANRAKPMVALLTYKLLQHAESLVCARKDPVQVWATLCENTADNSIFIHSPNPNGTPFPESFAGVEWGAAEPLEAKGLLKSTHEVGRLVREGEVVYFIRARGANHSLQARLP